MDDLVIQIDRNIDEVLVNLGNMVVRLSSLQVARTSGEREALARSVNPFTLCANHSKDPRVQKLAEELEDTLRPLLRLVSSR